MNYVIVEIAVCLAIIGLLGLLLGWWLGRLSQKRQIDDAVSDWQQRLSAADDARQLAKDEAAGIGNQLSDMRLEVEQANDRVSVLASNLNDSERQLSEERQASTSLTLQLQEKEEQVEALGEEVEKWRSDLNAQDPEGGQETKGELRQALESSRSRNQVLETSITTYIEKTQHQQNDLRELREEAVSLKADLLTLRGIKDEFQAWMQGAAAREEELNHFRLRSERSEKKIERLEASATDLRSSLEGREKEQATSARDANHSRQEVQALRDDLLKKERKISDLETKLAGAASEEEEKGRLQRELLNLGTDRENLESQARRFKARIAELEEALSNQQQPEPPFESPDGFVTIETPDELPHVPEAPVVEPISIPSTRPQLLDTPQGTPDDLKRIKGIGPVLERTLNELGVFHFAQIASWSPEEIAWVASHINTFPDRIERDEWIAQAESFARN